MNRCWLLDVGRAFGRAWRGSRLQLLPWPASMQATSPGSMLIPPFVEQPGERHLVHGPKEPADFRPVGAPTRRCLVDMAATGLEQIHRLPRQPRRPLESTRAWPRVRAVRDAQALDVFFQAHAIVNVPDGQAGVVERMCAGGRVQEQGRVSDRARHGSHVGDLVAVAHRHVGGERGPKSASARRCR